MPTDNYYDEMYEAERRYYNKRKKETEEYWRNKLVNLTDKEKLEFLIDNFINEKVKGVRM